MCRSSTPPPCPVRYAGPNSQKVTRTLRSPHIFTHPAPALAYARAACALLGHCMGAPEARTLLLPLPLEGQQGGVAAAAERGAVGVAARAGLQAGGACAKKAAGPGSGRGLSIGQDFSHAQEGCAAAAGARAGAGSVGVTAAGAAVAAPAAAVAAATDPAMPGHAGPSSALRLACAMSGLWPLARRPFMLQASLCSRLHGACSSCRQSRMSACCCAPMLPSSRCITGSAWRSWHAYEVQLLARSS